MTGGWQQTQELARGGDVTALRQSIDRNLQSDRSLNGLMSAVWSLEQAKGTLDVLNQYRSQAVQMARQQMRQGSNEPLPWVATAKFALEDRDDATFRQTTRELVQRFPTNPQGHYFEGLRAIQDQDWKGAEGSLKKARELGMSDESLAELLKMAIDNQKWIWQYAQLVFGVVAAWLCGLVALWVIGHWLSRATLRAIARDQVEAISSRERLVRRLYRVVVNVAGLYYYLSLPVVVVTAIALPLALGYATLMVPMLNLWLLAVILIGGLGGVLTAISGVRTAFVKVVDEPIGRSLPPEEAPRFWEFVREIAVRMETRPVDDIWLTPQTELAVTERGTWRQKLRDRGQRVLILGTGVLPGFKTDALRCVLAHEYAHFQHRDTAGGDVALRVSVAMDRFAEAIVSRGKIRWWDVTIHFLRLFHFLFRRLTLGASRLQEVLADRAAVRQCGASALEEGLRHVIRRSVEFDMLLSDAVRQSVRAQAVPLSFYSPSRPMKLEDREELETIVREVLGRRTTDDDSHPGPQERFDLAKRLGVDRPVGQNTAHQLFGETATRLTLDMASHLNDLVQARAEEIKAVDGFFLKMLSDRLRQCNDLALLEERAAIYFRLGRFAEATSDLNKILKEVPDAMRPLLSRSIVQEVDENFAAAANDLKRLRDMGYKLPFDVRFEVVYRHGKCLAELHRHEAAAEAFDEAIRMRSDSFLATVGRLQVAKELGELAQPEIVELRQRAENSWPDRAELRDLFEKANSHSSEDAERAIPNESAPNDDLPVLTSDDDDQLMTLEFDEEEVDQRKLPAARKSSTVSSGSNSESDLPILKWWHTALIFGGGSVAIGLLVGFAVHYLRISQPVVADRSPPAKVEPQDSGAVAPPAAPSATRSASPPTATVSVPTAETKTGKEPPPSPTLAFEQFGARLGEPLESHQIAQQAMLKLGGLFNAFKSLQAATGSYSPLPVRRSSGLSWRVHLLPQMKLHRLYEQFHLDEPWDSPHNLTLIDKMPEQFQIGTDVGLTRFRVFTGPDMPFEIGHTAFPQDFSDGENSTILVFFVGPDKAVPWTKPDDEPLDRSEVLKSLGLKYREPLFAVTPKGSVVCRYGLHPEKIAALATARGGEIVPIIDWLRNEPMAWEPPQSVSIIAPIIPGSGKLSSEQEEHYVAREKLKIIGQAMQKQHAQTQMFAPANHQDPNWRLLSWRVHLLPYLGHNELYRQFHLNEPWDSSHNRTLIGYMPNVFRLKTEEGRTRFSIMFGGLFLRDTQANLSRVTDDPATTAAVYYVARQRTMIWTEPESFSLYQDDPRKGLGVTIDDPITLLFANGDVTTLPPRAHPAKLYALFTPAGGEAIDLPTWFGSAEIAEKPPSATVTPPTPIRNAVKVPAVAAPDPAKLADFIPAAPDPTAKKLGTLGVAFFHHHEIHRQFSIPQNNDWYDKDGQPNLSWRVHLLPFLNQNALYEQFKLNEPWDSEHNRPLLSKMPDVFRSAASDKTTTRFCVLVGNETLFRVGKVASIRDTRDGSAHTILVAQVGSDKAVPWTKPEDLSFDAAHPLECLGNLGEQFHAVMADGYPLSIPTSLSGEVFAALATASGREIMDANTLRRYAAHHAGNPLGDAFRSRVLEQNKLKQVLLAMHNFHDENRHFPPTRHRKQLDTEGRPLLSWRVHVLRLLGHEPLLQQFRLDEPWDSPHNLQLLPLMPDVFRDSQAPVDSTTTRWLTFSGPNTPFPHLPSNIERGTSIRDFRDGTSNTILVMQTAPDRAVPWTKPDDLEVDLTAPLECLGTIPADTGLLVGLADGSARTLTRAIAAEQFKALITPNGNEVIDAASVLK